MINFYTQRELIKKVKELGLLSKEETYELFKKMQIGNNKAREELIIHNIFLIFSLIKKKYNNLKSNKEELFSYGLIGLIKAVDTFDITTNNNFSSYATVCINNSIIDYLKKQRKNINIISLDDQSIEEIEEELNNKNIIYKMSTEEEIINKELYKTINNYIKTLPELPKNVLYLYFGFFDGIEYNQRSIAEKLNISQPYVSKIIKTNLEKIKNMLIEKKLIVVKKLKYSRF